MSLSICFVTIAQKVSCTNNIKNRSINQKERGPVKQTLKLMRTYLHHCCTQWPSDWRIHKRWIIFRHYIRYLTRAYQKGVYVPATPEDEYTR